MLPFVREECKSGSNGSHMFSIYDMKMPKKGKSWVGLGCRAGVGCQVRWRVVTPLLRGTEGTSDPSVHHQVPSKAGQTSCPPLPAHGPHRSLCLFSPQLPDLCDS